MSPAPESLRAEVEEAIRSRRAATLDELGAEAVLWLAAPPVWTLGAARVAGFPVSSVTGFVRRACEAGWCKARGPVRDDAPGDLLFWMPDEVRREVIDVLQDRLGDTRLAGGYARVVEGASLVVGPLVQNEPPPELPEDELPGALRAWTALLGGNLALQVFRGEGVRPPSMSTRAFFASFGTIGTVLVQWTQQAVADRDLSRAQDLVAAGEAIAGVLAGSTEQALSRARRLLALGLRRRQDERALGRYQDRPELSAAVARLLNRNVPTGTQTPWALHLRGAGGVGKTMLIRYVASGRYAAGRGLPPIPVARADFDHISPDYPVRRPVQLLLELADELALHSAASERADRALSAFRARAARAHEAVSGLREAAGSPLRNEEVARAVNGFGAVLAELGDVLLILDTCEELAKADMGDPASPAVRATLDILERLSERAPSLRVLFAGRRPLPDRPYLAVQPVAGFTVDEARLYLATAVRRKLPVVLEDEIIRQSHAVDGPVPAAGRLPGRVSPFDLALYAAWACDDPDLDAAQVRRGSDAYIEGRIIERLDDPLVARALPLLASAGRCRVATIAALLDCDPDVLGRRLAQQEWIYADADPPVHVTARPALAARLRRYFGSDERRAEFAARNAALAAALVSRVREAPLAEIDADELIAALRLAEPPDAAALWDSIAERAKQPPGRWGTVLNLTRRVLGEWDEEQWPTTPALRATVTAAHIAASRRDSPLFNAQAPWGTVRAWAGEHPDPTARRRLLVRAALGLLPYTPDDEELWTVISPDISPPLMSQGNAAAGGGELAGDPDDRAAESGDQRFDPGFRVPGHVALADAFVDAAHRLLEVDLPGAARRLIRPLTLIALSSPAVNPRAWALVALARLAERDLKVAHSPLVVPHSLLVGAEGTLMAEAGQARSWPDWIEPDDLLARVRIERGLITPPEDLSVLDEWESYAAEHLGSIDGERLASLCLRIRLRHGVVDADVAERWEAADPYTPDRVPTCTAHDLVPPLCASVSQAWLAAGKPERALALLDRRRSQAVGTRQDDIAVRDVDAATVAVIRRLRLTDRRSLLVRLASPPAAPWAALGPSGGRVRGQAMRTLGLLTATRAAGAIDALLASVAPYQDDPETWHAWWQSTAPRALSLLSAIPPAMREWPLARSSEDLADIRADLAEMRRLRVAAQDGSEDTLTAWKEALAGWLDQPVPAPPPARSAEPYRELRAHLRMAALGATRFERPQGIPRRLLAEMAFEEGELMALRLPEPAAVLFRRAAGDYAAAGDALGELLARLSVVRSVIGSGTEPGSSRDGGRPFERLVHIQAASTALNQLVERDPALAARVAGPPEEAGLWRYWAEAELSGYTQPRPTVQAPPSGYTQPQPTVQAPPWGPTFPAQYGRAGSGQAASDETEASPPAPVVSAADPGGSLTYPGPSGVPGASSPAPGPLGPAPPKDRAERGIRRGSLVSVVVGALAYAVAAVCVALALTSSPQVILNGPNGEWPSGGSGGGSSPLLWIAALATGLGTLSVLISWRVRIRSRRPGVSPPGPDPTASAAPGSRGHPVPPGKAPGESSPEAASPEAASPEAASREGGAEWSGGRRGGYLTGVARLAMGRGIGVAQPGVLRLNVTIATRDADASEVRLVAHLKPWRTAPPRVRVVLGFLAPAVWLAGLFQRDVTGYSGMRVLNASPTRVDWAKPPPEANATWWRKGRGTALGIIRGSFLLPEPWERTLSSSLGADAAGRVEWIRLVSGARPYDSHFGTSQLVASPAWGRALRGSYTSPTPLAAETGVRHVIGRAIATSAGPVMDVSGDAEAVGSAFLEISDLKLGEPGIVILQAEPVTGDVADARASDDHAEKLELGAALAGDGVPAVLLLPALPAGIAGELSKIITEHARDRRGGDAQGLLSRLRAAIAPHVPPLVLDDVVLFLNEARYRS